MGHPWALDVHLHLYADYGPDEEAYEQHYAYGVDAELRHFLYVAFGEHAHAFRNCERAPHKYEIAAESSEVTVG